MAMELANVTGFPALLFRTAIDQTRRAAAVVARVSYRIAPGGQLTRAEEQPWGVSRAPWEGPAGPMPSDEVFYRGGVAQFVFGEAWAPGGRPVSSGQVQARVRAGRTGDAQGRLTARRGRYFNDAFPALGAPTARPGDIVELEGVTPDGALGFVIPPPPLVAEVSAGAARLEGPLNVDQIGVEPALRRVFITYRHAFRYTVTARQRRTCALRALGGN